ncbi:hypothetical protein CDV36_001975 [Fusarium kuroshium]|uniref:Uncharacterized protein n=1 Tax=Fusarium kuroshium TaxID=2010991 RepID=A0A3M2SLB2_9HYPO|nr:hypothetical protein CDV36_001975 [Fusarium kuroshium]
MDMSKALAKAGPFASVDEMFAYGKTQLSPNQFRSLYVGYPGFNYDKEHICLINLECSSFYPNTIRKMISFI